VGRGCWGCWRQARRQEEIDASGEVVAADEVVADGGGWLKVVTDNWVERAVGLPAGGVGV
jgi:hypothetical protein